jgi:WXXGXW repeat (2 copies)
VRSQQKAKLTTIGNGMRRLVAGLVLMSLSYGPCVLAQDKVDAAKLDYPANFPPSGYRPLPPHFQPRRLIAADLEKVSVAPPPLPTYEQPPAPAQGYLWVPGFWAWRKSVPDYFWVPGTWVRPPHQGLLWTPPYWSQVEGGYAFHSGYWATEVGFYGGISYGYGYDGNSYQGGRWEKNGAFSYNRAVNNLGSLDDPHVYDQPVSADGNAVNVSYNGGAGGVDARATKQQEALANEEHVGAAAAQRKHFELAAMDRSLYSKLNNSQPAVAATPRAGVFTGAGITHSRGGMPDRSAESGGTVTSGGDSK